MEHLEHPDQAPALILTVRTPPCGHTVLGNTLPSPLFLTSKICTKEGVDHLVGRGLKLGVSFDALWRSLCILSLTGRRNA